MKVLPFTIPKPNNDALLFQVDKEYIFYDQLHQHAEIQLSYIADGSGTLIVGDAISSYGPGDIIVIDAHLPHVFKSEPSMKQSLMLSLFFTKESFGTQFFSLGEMKSLDNFFRKARQGFKVSQHTLHHHFSQLESQNGLNKFINFLTILEQLSNLDSIALSSFVSKPYTDLEGQRMSAITDYTITHFDQDITLKKIASVANLTPNAFCKYFKKRTNKSYFSFLNELKISRACQLLQSSPDLSIVEIAEMAGFNNLSNFNRQFKRLKNTTPSRFKTSS